MISIFIKMHTNLCQIFYLKIKSTGLKNLEIKNFIDPKYLSFREKKILKLYLRKVRELKG